MKTLLLFFASISITFGVMEFYLRLARITPPTLKYYDNKYGALNRPDIDYFKSVEGYYIGRTNYDGRFGENYAKRKPDRRTLRIVLVGDSFVEGIDVLSRNHFARSMERLLGEKLQRKVEIMNFGRGNCTLHASSYYFQNHIVPNYDADLVLYFTEARDAGESTDYPSTTWTNGDGQDRPLVAGYHWRSTPEYLLHQKLSAIPIVAAYDTSSYFRLLYRARAGILMQGFPNITLGDFYGARPVQDYRFVEATEEIVSPLTCKIFDSVYGYNDGQVVYVVRSMPLDARMITSYMKMKSYKFIDLNDAFDGYHIKGTKIDAYYFKASMAYGGHWNNEGHRAIGRFLTDSILAGLESYNMPNYEK